jgi:hypothetical protein
MAMAVLARREQTFPWLPVVETTSRWEDRKFKRCFSV